jgi:hypothetical protein
VPRRRSAIWIGFSPWMSVDVIPCTCRAWSVTNRAHAAREPHPIGFDRGVAAGGGGTDPARSVITSVAGDQAAPALPGCGTV